MVTEGSSQHENETTENNLLRAFVQQLEQMNAQRVPPGMNDDRMSKVLNQFKKLGPLKFKSMGDSIVAKQWIHHLKDIFEVVECFEVEKRKLAMFQLLGEARNWWKLLKSTMGEAAKTMTWTTFQEKFLDKYFPEAEKEKKELEFMELKQGTITVMEYQNKFEALARFVPHLVEKSRLCARKFTRGFVPPIRKMMIVDAMLTYEEVVSKALNHENDNMEFKKEMQAKNKGKTQQQRGQDRSKQQAWKRQNVGDGANKVTLVAQTEAPKKTKNCYNCGVPGHMAKDYRSAPNKPKCFNYGGIGHMIRECTKYRALNGACHNCEVHGHYANDYKNPNKNKEAQQGGNARLYAMVVEQTGVESNLSMFNCYAKVLFDTGA